MSTPRIAILMAVYEPDMDWLAQQLDSLDAQTYSNLFLYVRDDCSPTTPHEVIAACVQEHITAFPFTLARNEENLGSNATFEKLTAEAEGDYFAYCDQDDVWLPDKLTTLLSDMLRENAQLVCSDMHVIDAQGRQTAECITQVRRHQVLRGGTGLAPDLLTHNFVTGCTMLVHAETAKAALPFCPYMVHDQYLALWSAARGRIYSEPRPLICYRLHGGNQTSGMAGVADKASYCRVRIDESIRKFEWLQAHFPCEPELSAQMERDLAWLRARQKYWREKKGAAVLWRLRNCGKQITLFELFAAHFPQKLFLFFIQLYRKNII